MTDKQALRSTILQESEPIGTKQRFGFFSQPISTAIGDDGAYKTKIHQRGENGKPVTLPRNVYTNPTKKGQLSYFEPIKSLATSEIKDVFIEEGKRLLKQENERFGIGRKQANFIPASLSKTLANPSYKYIEQNNPELDPKRNRAEDGRVKSMPRNAFTNPMSKVSDQVFKQPKHISDPYDRKHKMEVELMKKNKALQAESAFRPNSFCAKTFSTEKQVYGLDVEITKKPSKEPQFNIFPHEVPFRRSSPMKDGHQGFISPFPKYMENPPKEKTRIDHKPNEKGEFRSMSACSSKPSPSITLMSARRNLNSSFRR